MKNLIVLVLLLCSSCAFKSVRCSLILNVKEYQENKMVACGERKIDLEFNKQCVSFLDISLKVNEGYFKDADGVSYDYRYEVNDSGLFLYTVAPNKKSYILSTSGKCL